MAKKTVSPKHALELENLRARLTEAEDTLRAIQQGEVDALVVAGADGPQTFTLHSADQIYRLLVETMNEGALAVDQTGLTLYANQRLAALLATPLENLLGAPFASLVAPEDSPALDNVWQAMRQGQPTHLEITLVGSQRVPVLLSMAPFSPATVPGMSVLVTDLTHQKRIEAELRLAQTELQQQVRARTEDLSQAVYKLQRENHQREVAEEELVAQLEELKAAEEDLRIHELQLRAQNDELETAQAQIREHSRRYQALFDFAPDGYMVTDVTGLISEANRAAARLFHVHHHNLIGQPLAAYVVPDLQPLYYGQLDEMLRHLDEPQSFELSVIDGDGRLIPVEITAVAMLSDDHQVVGARWALRDISERKQAQAALEAAHTQLVNENHRLEAVMETLPVGLAILDAEGGSLNSNARFEAAWRSPRPVTRHVDEFANYHAWWVDTGQPVKPAEWASARAVRQGETVIGQTMRIQRFDGSYGFILNSAAPILDASGKIAGCAVAIQDITAQMEADEALRRSTERFQLLSDVAGKLLATDNPQAIVTELCSDVMAHLDCQAFFNFIAEPESLRLNAYAGIDAARAAQIQRLEYGAAVCGCVAQTGEHMVVEDLQHSSDPRTNLVRANGLQAYACHPLLAGDRVLGTVSFGTKTRLRFTAEELAVMKTVADQVAIAMDRIRSAEALRRALDLAEDGQRLLEALMEFVPEGISIADGPEGSIRMVSRYGQELLGGEHTDTTVQEVVDMWRVYREDGITPLPIDETPLMRAVRHGEIIRDQEIVQVNSIGQHLALLCNAAPLRNAAGAVTGAVVAWRDITARKQMENALRLSEQRFRLALKNAPITVATQDRNLRFTWTYNQRSVQPETVIGKSDFEVFPPETAAQLQALKRRVLETGSEAHEALWVSSAGCRFFLDLYLEPILDEAGETAGVGITTVDLTEQMRAEAALRESEARYRSLFNNMTEGFALHEIICDEAGQPSDYRFLDINPAFERLTGLRREAVVGRLKSAVLPGDDAHWLKIYGNVALTGEPVHFENHASALRQHYEVFSFRPAPMQFAVIFLNVTARKEAEAALEAARAELEQRVADRTLDLQLANAQLQAEVLERRQVEQQLRLQTSALQAAANSIVITNRQGEILWSNPAFTALTGYSAAEALGQTLRLVRSDQQPPDFYHALWQTILAGEVWQGEMVNRRKDGALYTEQQTITPVRDEAGQISHFVAIKRDVTEHRRLELELLNANVLLEKVFASIDLLVAYLDRDFTYLRVNRAYAAAARQAPDDFAGRRVFDLHPDPENEAIFRQVVNTGEPYTAYEQPLNLVAAGDPGPSYWDWSLQPVRDTVGRVQGLVFSLVNVSQRKQAEDRLRLNAQRSQALAEISQTLAEATFDLPSVLRTVVRRTAELYEDICLVSLVAESEARITTEIVHHPDPALASELQSCLPAGSVSLADTRIAHHIISTGQPLLIPMVTAELGANWFGPEDWTLAHRLGICSVLGVPLQAQGHVLGQILLFRLRSGLPYTADDQQTAHSLADRAALAIVNGRLYQNLQTALEQEKSTRAQLVQAEKLAAMGRVVGSVAHEINNPLQTINNCLFLTAGDLPPDSPVHEYLQMAFSETERLTNLVAQLRQVYRPNPTGILELLNLLPLLQQVQALLAPPLERHRVEWRLATSLADAPVHGVADQLKQVFINLGQNAIEAMQSNGGVLTVNVALSENTREIGVSFVDTGPGLSAATLDRLFEPFFTTKSTGLGLGLPICNDIIKRHHGRIVAESHPGEGAVFTVWLPALASHHA